MIRTRVFSSALEVTVLTAASLAMFLQSGGLCQAALSECIDATCRITTAEGSCGSGCVFEIGNGSVYVLTAGHVTGKAAAVQCEFWRQGHQVLPAARPGDRKLDRRRRRRDRRAGGRAGRPAARRRPAGPAGRSGRRRRYAPLGRMRQRHLVHRLEGTLGQGGGPSFGRCPRAEGGRGRTSFRPRAGQRTERLGPLRRRGQAYRRRHHRADRRWPAGDRHADRRGVSGLRRRCPV